MVIMTATSIRPYAEHLEQPSHQGRLAQATSTGTVGSIVVGAALRFFIRVEDDRISEAKYQVFNCAEQVPAASLLSEWVTGRSVDEAAAVDLDDLITVGQAERIAFPFMVWSIEALHDAIHKMSSGGAAALPAVAPNDVAALLCRCHGVSREAVEAAIKDGAADVEAVQQTTSAGTGCGSCQRDIAALLDQRPPVTAGTKGRIALLKQIGALAQPLIDEAAAMGSKLELWDLKDHQVCVRLSGLSGPLATDSHQHKQLIDKLERGLKDEVDPLLTLDVTTTPAP